MLSLASRAFSSRLYLERVSLRDMASELKIYIKQDTPDLTETYRDYYVIEDIEHGKEVIYLHPMLDMYNIVTQAFSSQKIFCGLWTTD